MGCVSSQQKEENNQFKPICEKYHIQYKSFKGQSDYIKQKGYQIEQMIGTNFGDCIVSVKDSQNQVYAIKIINYESFQVLDDTQQAKSTYDSYKENKYILQTERYLVNKQIKSIFAVRELCDCSLRDFINANTLAKNQIFAITKQLLEGLISIRKARNNQQINTNIKPENILYKKSNNAFLFSDLDCPIEALIQNQQTVQMIKYTTLKQSQISLYSSPEVTRNYENFSNKTDLFSLGLSLAELIRGKKFLNHQLQDIRDRDCLKRYLPKNTHYEDYIDKILINMVKVKPEDRLDPQSLLDILQEKFQTTDQDLLSIKDMETPQSVFQLIEPKQNYQEVWVTKEDHTKLKKTDKYININLSMSNFDDEMLDSVTRSLSHCHDTLRLEINCFANYDITDFGLQNLIEVINKFHNIQKLKLEFPSCEKINGSALNYLAKGLKNLKHLDHLNLKFDECQNLQEDVLFQLSEGIQNCTSITKLYLSFQQCQKLTSEGLQKLAESMKQCKNIKNVVLNFNKCSKISDSGLVNLVNTLQEAKSLKKLYLSFCSTLIGNESIKKLSELFQKQKQLEQFQLDIKDTKADEDLQILKLFENMQLCIDLEEIKLNFKKLNFENPKNIVQQISGYYKQNKYMEYELQI
ncbi:kinase domain protein (macronuclear) [Tetrahymena thermophila SB210]|uniref:non-specific serine/threonine protein kinase n=1 Tax=Tetrahymena thermophila (strain SB210) TaxID=312017 RepID=Q22XI6_TETTS|nr:kinase domain protein [Tetrahymena thermophila SB210]EAR90024.1 kinase domain protein [Tetrahymena thermophila SB210]|eukprot:XP_001010269.1 kinase domain protein [Tetrahymena thermophila SB210]